MPSGHQSVLGIFQDQNGVVWNGSRKDKPVRIVVLIAVAVSLLFNYLPALQGVSGGFVVIICAVVAATLGAVFFPIEGRKEGAA